MRFFKFAALFAFALFANQGHAQIIVTNTQTPEELVNDVLVGAGVIISNVEFNHSVPLAGAVQAMAGYFDASGTDFPLGEGVILASGNVRLAEGPNDTGGATDNDGVAVDPNDIDLDAIGTATINNEAVLEFDFIPSGDSVVFNYIFGSEEYLEFVDAGFNDVFGFFISGPGFTGPYEFGAENIATIPGTAIPVTIDNLNDEDFPEFYVNNDGGTSVQYDGHTTVLTARASVECGETYHIKIAIGDAGDTALDSGVFLEASSFSSNGVTVEIASVLGEDALIEGCDSAQVCFIRPEESDTVELTVDYTIGGTATNGVDYPLLDETVTFEIGVDTVKKWIVPEDDGIVEGTEDVIITVEIINECGDTITSDATIAIIDPYEIEVTTEDILIECAEDSVMITFETTGVDPLDIDWSSGGTEVEEWVPGDIEGTTTYTVEITDVCGETATGTVDVVYDPASDVSITFAETEFTICPGSEVFIDATVVDPYDPAEVTYDWDPSGDITEDITITPDEEGYQVLTVWDGCGFAIDSVLIEFGEVILDDITVIDAVDCPGVPDATLGSILVDPDNPDWTYELVGYVDPQDSGVFEDLSGGIDYILIVTDEFGCTLDTVVTVGLGENEVTAMWEADSLRDVSCFGANDGGAYVYGISGGISDPFTAVWTNEAGIFDTETGIPDGGDAEHDGLPGGNYVITITDDLGCAWSYSFEIFEPEELTIDIIFNEPSCTGFTDGSVTVLTSGGNGGETYIMTNEDGEVLNVDNSNTINTLGTGTYFVEVIDENGCTASGSVFLNDPAPLDAELIINDPLCYGQATGSVEVDTVFNFQGEYDAIGYYWAPNPFGDNGIGENTVTKLEAGDYTLTINDENGCSHVIDFEIVYPDSLYWTELGYHPAYCRLYGYQNGNGEVYASATGGTGSITYEWMNLETFETEDNTTWGGLNPGTYVIVAEDDNGCEFRDTVVVDSLNPMADFIVTSDELNADLMGTAPVSAIFTNTSMYFANPKNPLADTTFFWNLDTLHADYWVTEDYFIEPDTIYGPKGQSYEVVVCLTAFNKNGCQDTECKTLTIFEPISLTNVNIFSPNGDGVNDEFTFDFYAKSISEFKCVIVNRWGIQVGEINDIADGWDGTDMNGDPCKDGVYFYTYRAVSDNSTVIEGQGTVTISK